MLAEGFRGPEKAGGTFGFASSQGKRWRGMPRYKAESSDYPGRG